MKIRFYIFFAFLFSSFTILAQPKIKLDTFSRAYTNAVDIANDGSTSRLFIVSQTGLIHVLDSNGAKLDTFLDIRTRVQASSEEGLLGLAFSPNYNSNGYFYVYYTKKNTTDNAVFRYKVTGNPNKASVDSELLVINLPHPGAGNHNGGCLKFGNDGYLYISTGDGGGAGDISNNAQNKNGILGKILRIDVSRADTTYMIPSTNPLFSQSNVRKEIWAYGLRNPWRYSFDRLTHDLWIGDVGQGAWEEVDFQAASSTGGENYGWRCYEGNNTYNTSGCLPASNYVFPVYAYDHSGSGGIAVTGGFVYRGNKYSDLQGYYVTADYGTGNFWVIKKTGSTFTTTALGKPLTGANVSAFGEDIRGEMYASNVTNGVIYKIRELCSSLKINLVDLVHPSCPNVLNGSIQVGTTGSNGVVTYAWSNGATSGSTVTNLGPGKYVVTANDAIGCVRKDSFVLYNADTLRIGLTSLVNPSCPNVSNGSIEIAASHGNGNYSYNWSNGEGTNKTDSIGPGKYVVTVNDGNNCSAKDSFVLHNIDTLRISLLNLKNPSCPNVVNGSIEIAASNGNGSYSYNWSNGETSGLNDSLAPGKYVVYASDGNNCMAADSFVLFNTDTLDIPVITQVANSLQTAAGFTYVWKRNDTILPTYTLNVIYPPLTGAYKVEITDANGCKATSDPFGFIFTGIKNKNTDIEKLSLYPNPVSDNLSIDIRFTAAKKVTLRIVNMIGQVVYEEKLQGKDISKIISLKDLPKGVYELAISMEDGKVMASSFMKE